MKQLKLLCSYEEWKQKKSCFTNIGEDTAKMLALGFNFNRTAEEEKEYQLLEKKTKENFTNEKYTDLTYEIMDIYNELKYVLEDEDRKEIYINIGRKQCEIEILREEKE